MKKSSTLVLLFCILFGFSQNINQYKYAQVPSKFKFSSQENEYNLSIITKAFMAKYGFETYIDNELLPSNFASENCNKVFVDIENTSTMFTTKLTVVLKDCKNVVLVRSPMGTSREKEFAAAYNQAIQMAFTNFNQLKAHQYKPLQKSIETIDKPDHEKTEIEVFAISSKNNLPFLLAQSIANGFQLVTADQKVVYKILKTSIKDFYIATSDNKQGVFFLKDNQWFFEYYENQKLVSEMVNISFK